MNEKQYCRVMAHCNIESSMICLNQKCSNCLCWICAQCLIEQDHSQQKELHFCEQIGFDIQKNKVIKMIKNAEPQNQIKEGIKYFEKVGQQLYNIIQFYIDRLEAFHNIVTFRRGSLQNQLSRVQRMDFQTMTNQDIEYLGKIDTMIDAASERKIIQDCVLSFKSDFNKKILEYVANNIDDKQIKNQTEFQYSSGLGNKEIAKSSKLGYLRSFISKKKPTIVSMSQSMVLDRDQVSEFQCVQPNPNKLKQLIPYWHKTHINSISISSDNQFLVSGGQDKYLKVWNIQTDKMVFEENFNSPVDAVAISNDNKQITIALQQLQLLIYNFDLEKINIKEYIEIQSQITKIFYIDITKLVVIGKQVTNIITYQNNEKNTVKIQIDNIIDADYSYSHKLFAVGAVCGSVHLYNSKSNSILKSYNKAHQKQCNSIKFQLNQNQILSCGLDDTVKLWNMDLHLLKTISVTECLQAYFLNCHPYIVVHCLNNIQIIRLLSSQVVIQNLYNAHHLKKFDMGLSAFDDSFLIYRCNHQGIHINISQVCKLNISLSECC
ncbi:NET1-associated nuclear protein 1 [Paramecium bursaria]